MKKFSLIIFFIIFLLGVFVWRKLYAIGDVILKIDLDNIAYHLDPAANMTNSSWYILNSISVTLFDMAEDQSITGLLAESWQSYDQNQRYIIKIREDAFFQDGSQITTKDILFSLKRKQKLSPKYELFDWIDFFDENSVNLIDDRTIEFRLKKPYNFFLFILALPGTGIVPAHIYPFDKFYDESKLPILGGAYEVKEWERKKYIKLQIFKKWFGNKDRIPQEIIIYEKQYSEHLEDFIKGKTNFLIDTQKFAVNFFNENKNSLKEYNYFYPQYNTVSLAYLNAIEGPFRNKDLRKIFAAVLREYHRIYTSDNQNVTLASEFYPPGYSGRTGNYKLPDINDYKSEIRRLQNSPIQIRLIFLKSIAKKTKNPRFYDFLKKYGFEILYVELDSYQELKEMKIKGSGFDLGFWFIPLTPGDPCLVYRLDFGKDDFYIRDPNNGKLYEMIHQTSQEGQLEERIRWAKAINDYINEELFIIPLLHSNVPIYSTKEFDLSFLPKWQFNTRFYHVKMK